MTALIKSVCTYVLLGAIFLFDLSCRIVRRGWALSRELLAHLRFHTAPRLGRLTRQAYARIAPQFRLLLRHVRAQTVPRIGRLLHKLCARTVLLIGLVVRRIRRQPAGDSKAAVPVTTWLRRHVR